MKSGRALLAGSHLPNYPLRTAVDSEQKVNLLIRYFWARGTDCILETWVVNTIAASYVKKTLEKSLATAEWEKILST